MKCKLCQHNIENHSAVYAAINELEQSGELPAGSYSAIVERVCSSADCPSAQ